MSPPSPKRVTKADGFPCLIWHRFNIESASEYNSSIYLGPTLEEQCVLENLLRVLSQDCSFNQAMTLSAIFWKLITATQQKHKNLKNLFDKSLSVDKITIILSK